MNIIIERDYYVLIGNIRDEIVGRFDSYNAYLANNKLSMGNLIVHGNTFKKQQDFIWEDGKLYLSLPYLLFNGPTIDFKILL